MSVGKTERRFFARLMADAPFQPATNFWRAVEIAAIRPSDVPAGQGLDLGCGDGRLTRLVLDHVGARALVGLDPDPLETRLAVEEGIYQRVHTAFGDAIPEAAESFDFVFSNSVLEHIPRIEPVIAEVGRVLRPGGCFVFTVPSDRFHACLSGPWLPWTPRRRYLAMVDRRCAHVRYWGTEDWRRALAPAGLRIIAARAYLSRRETQRWENLSRLTAGLLYVLTAGRRRPIDIQRGLGLRGRRLPTSIAAALARLLASRPAPSEQAAGSCLLIVAERIRD
jgi:SAM-dependent methyltransferase